MIYLCSGMCVLVLAYFGWTLTARSAYESADYTLIESDGSFEVREYPDLMMATTHMRAEVDGDDGSFMRLFRYISGRNAEEQKVAMTTPVFMQRDHESDDGRMGFVIPSRISADRIPAPSEAGVAVSQREGGRFAVIRFSGQMSRSDISTAEIDLREWMAARDLRGVNHAEYAGYDPPWTPGPWRRNEVLIRLK